jgi:two-component system, cell cycle sensor histidine kinase and response regulator CckA
MRSKATNLSSEMLEQAILDQVAEAVVVCDVTGQIIRVNERAATLCGQNPAGQMFQHVFHLQPAHSTPFSLTEAVTKSRQRLEAQLIQNGQEIDLLLSINPLLSNQKEQMGTVITLTDITERKHAENKILEAQSVLERMLDETDQSRRALLSLVEDQQQAEMALQERLKEMACLYAIRRDMSLDLTLDQLCPRIVEHLAAGMQFPDLSVPFIELDNTQFTSEKYRPELNHYLGTDIILEGEKRGHLRVYYTEEKAFLIPEEQELLNAIAEALQMWLARTQAEAARRRSEQLLNETQALSKIGGWEYNVATEAISWTDEVYRILGVGTDVDLNNLETSLGFYAEQDQQRLLAAFESAVATNQPYELEIQFTAGDGQRKWVYTSGKPVFQDGQLVKMVGNIMDITERKQHEQEQEAIVAVSAALRQAQSQADMLPIVVDQLLVLLHAEAAALALHDPADDTAVIKEARGEFGTSLHVRLPLDKSVSGAVIRSGEPFVTTNLQQNTTFYRADLRGTIEAAACVPLLVQKQAIGVVWVGRQNPFSPAELRLLTAITDMAANAIHRSALYEQTEAQAEEINQIINSAPDGMLLLDEQHKILLANPVARNQLALLADATLGHIVTHLGNRPLEELLTSPPVGRWHNITQQNKFFEVIARPLAAGPTASGWVMVLRDVTERRLVQQQLQQQERLAAIGQMAAGIAHDFNNLMAVITLYSQLLSHSPGLTERDRERLATINKQANHAVRMIQQILDFSRRSVLERQPLDLHALLDEQIELLRRTLPEHIEIVWYSEEDECLIEADATRIQQAIMNLAVNARDAMPDGGHLTLEIDRLEITGKQQPVPEIREGEWIRLTITDSGAGIAAEHLDHLFEPFFTTKTPDKGTGLGLAQVHGIVAQHDGHITVASRPGQGTTFTVYLPALPVEGDAALIPDDTAIPRGQGELILVVEDDATLRTALTDYLQMWGYQTLQAANGEVALQHLQKQNQVALILSDVVMPRLGGINLFRALRQQGGQIPIILLTGHPLEEEMIAKLRTEGLHAWLPKPPNLIKLAQTIASALAQNKQVSP